LSAGDKTHDLTEHAPTQIHQPGKIRSADIHINGSTRARPLFKQAGLFYNRNDARHLMQDILENRDDLFCTKGILGNQAHKDHLTVGHIKEIRQQGGVMWIIGIRFQIFRKFSFYKLALGLKLINTVSGRREHDTQNHVSIPFRKIFSLGGKKPGHGQCQTGQDEHRHQAMPGPPA